LAGGKIWVTEEHRLLREGKKGESLVKKTTHRKFVNCANSANLGEAADWSLDQISGFQRRKRRKGWHKLGKKRREDTGRANPF